MTIGVLFLSQGIEHLISNNSLTKATADSYCPCGGWACTSMGVGAGSRRVEMGRGQHEHLLSAALDLWYLWLFIPFLFSGKGDYSSCIRCGLKDSCFHTLLKSTEPCCLVFHLCCFIMLTYNVLSESVVARRQVIYEKCSVLFE